MINHLAEIISEIEHRWITKRILVVGDVMLDKHFWGDVARAHVLAAMASVDAVVIFSEPTPLELIVVTKPDAILKGGDYDPVDVVGARQVQSWGAGENCSLN